MGESQYILILFAEKCAKDVIVNPYEYSVTANVPVEWR